MKLLLTFLFILQTSFASEFYYSPKADRALPESAKQFLVAVINKNCPTLFEETSIFVAEATEEQIDQGLEYEYTVKAIIYAYNFVETLEIEFDQEDLMHSNGGYNLFRFSSDLKEFCK